MGWVTGWSAEGAAGVEFDARSLRQGTSTDLRHFEQQGIVPEGSFNLDITVNKQWKGRHEVQLRRRSEHGQSEACYTQSLLHNLGVDLLRLDSQVRHALNGDQACIGLDMLNRLASETLEFGNLRLNLQIAQHALRRQSPDVLPPEQWDRGVTTGFVNYSFNHHERQDLQRSSHTRRGFLGLRSGFNSGGWYWRHTGNWQFSDSAANRYQAGATSVRTDIPAWSAQVTLGDGHSRGEVFPSNVFRGVLLGSDERMLPREQRGFAPTVRGVAHSNALLSIRQRGILLHESTIAPGPFEIDDLEASGLGEDLQVTLREADGSERTFIVPNQAAPLALRPGASRFEVGSGVWRNESGSTGPGFAQGSVQYGLNNHLSLHGGTWLAQDYLASAMGVAINSTAGAFGLTQYQSRSRLSPRQASSGGAVRVSWYHRLGGQGTGLGVTLTQSDSANYLSFDEFVNASRRGRVDPSRRWLQLSVHQQLGQQAGRLSLTASDRRSWQGGRRTGYNLGYSNHLGAFSYGLNISREQVAVGRALTAYTFNASLPLGERRRAALSSGLNLDSQGRSSSNLRWSGIGGDHGQWGYGLSATHQRGAPNDVGFDANLRHSGASGVINSSLANRRGFRQASVGMQGAVVAHAGGVIAAPPLGESFAIIHAPGALDAGIRQHPQIRLDRRGMAVLPSLSPYTLNNVELDPKGMSRDVELQVAGQTVFPRAGAAALLHYPTRTGRLVMVEVRLGNGSAIPFGALVIDVDGQEQGLVGQGSQLFVRSDGELHGWRVVWGDAEDEQCWLDHRPPPGEQQTRAVCKWSSELPS